MSSTKSIVLSVVVTAAGIALYHVTLGSRPGSPGGGDVDRHPTDDAVAALRRDVDQLKDRSSGGGDPSSARVDALLARVAALEGRLIPASAESGAGGSLPPGVAEKSVSFTEEQIASFRALLDEAERRKSADRETASFRDLVRRVAPTLSAADEASAVSLITGFMRTVRVLFVNGSAGNTDEERSATTAKAAAERQKLLADLATFLPKDVVERMAQHIPDFGASPGHTPPNREGPK